jgi:uncharacterized protein
VHVRRLIVAVHRDVGFLVAGLTIVYAVSGIAVNHVGQWNPSFVVRSTIHQLGPLDAGSEPAAVAREVLDRLGERLEPAAVVAIAPGVLRVVLEGRTLTVFVAEGRVADERVTRRPVLFSLNYLHLNTGKGAWTWWADAYAVALLLLALTGIFVVPGRKGLAGRGRWLLAAGILLPVFYLLLKR